MLRDFFVFEQAKLVGQPKVNAVGRVEGGGARRIVHNMQSIYGAIIVCKLAAAIFSLNALQQRFEASEALSVHGAAQACAVLARVLVRIQCYTHPWPIVSLRFIARSRSVTASAIFSFSSCATDRIEYRAANASLSSLFSAPVLRSSFNVALVNKSIADVASRFTCVLLALSRRILYTYATEVFELLVTFGHQKQYLNLFTQRKISFVMRSGRATMTPQLNT